MQRWAVGSQKPKPGGKQGKKGIPTPPGAENPPTVNIAVSRVLPVALQRLLIMGDAQRLPRWYEDAVASNGELFEGMCLRVAVVEAGRLDLPVGYQCLGMFDPWCPCSWCEDRHQKFVAKQLKIEETSMSSAAREASAERCPVNGVAREASAERCPAADASRRLYEDRRQIDQQASGGSPQNARRSEEAQSTADASQDEAWYTFNWIQLAKERFAVRRPMFNDILMRLGHVQPSVDAFADSRLHLMDRWWGPGSEVPDSMLVSWKNEPLLWCNPPFSMMGEVVDKLLRDRARAVLIMPHWTNQQWFLDVERITICSMFYRRKTMMFETDNGMMPGTPWAIWALLVDGNVWNQRWGMEEYDPDQEKFDTSESSYRRDRRKKKKAKRG